MARGENLFWVASAPEAARQICKAILARKSHAYVTKRWRLVAWLLKSLPDSLYHRI
jgi:short-subunit dehydrogenase